MDDVKAATDRAKVVDEFRSRVETLGLWDGGWVAGMAILGPSGWICFALRMMLVAPGVRVPDKCFDASTKHALVRSRFLPTERWWQLLERIAANDPSLLTELFGQSVQLPEGPSSASMRSDASIRFRDHRSHLLLERYVGGTFQALVGYETFDRLRAELSGHRPPYGGPREVSANMSFLSASPFDSAQRSPIFEASAEIPLGPLRAFYNPAHRGIEVQVDAGASLPLKRINVSLTPDPRRIISGDEFEVIGGTKTRELRSIVSCAEPKSAVTVSLQFDDIAIAEVAVQPRADLSGYESLFRQGDRRDDWEKALADEFHLTKRRLTLRLAQVLPRRLVDLALGRIAESIRMKASFPFFSVVSAASVAELLLNERIAKVKKRARVVAWAELRAADTRLDKALPNELRFDKAILLATHLGVVDDIASTSLDLLRVARNEIHLDRASRPTKEDFSPVRAAGAILATLDLCKRAAARRRPKRKKNSQSVATSIGSVRPVLQLK